MLNWWSFTRLSGSLPKNIFIPVWPLPICRMRYFPSHLAVIMPSTVLRSEVSDYLRYGTWIRCNVYVHCIAMRMVSLAYSLVTDKLFPDLTTKLWNYGISAASKCAFLTFNSFLVTIHVNPLRCFRYLYIGCWLRPIIFNEVKISCRLPLSFCQSSITVC